MASNTNPKGDAEAEEAKLQAKHKESCNTYVKDGLTTNRSIQFLIQKLDEMGCTPPQGFIRCIDCEDMKALGAFHLLSEETMENVGGTPPTPNSGKEQGGGTIRSIPAACSTYFSETLKKISSRTAKSERDQNATQHQKPIGGTAATATTDYTTATKTPEIFLCQQYLSSEGQTHRTMVHELIHAIDTCRTKMDPNNNCIHLACTEIRAENLSGECNFWNELMKIGPHSLKKHGQDCVKRRAMISVGSHPRCRDRSEEYVDAAMRRCYNDIFPFERHPNEQPPF